MSSPLVALLEELEALLFALDELDLLLFREAGLEADFELDLARAFEAVFFEAFDAAFLAFVALALVFDFVDLADLAAFVVFDFAPDFAFAFLLPELPVDLPVAFFSAI